MSEEKAKLELQSVRCVRGERLLFSKLNFQCAAGTLVRIAGPNGTGKTSLLRLLVGLMQPQEGQILWKNEPIKKLKEEFWKDLVYIGHLNGVKDELTARENLLINCEIGEHPVTKEQADHALAMVGLALARLYLSRHAGFWVLDEPFTALDVKAVANLANLIAEHVNEGGIVAFTTHQEVPIAANNVQRIELTGGRWLNGRMVKKHDLAGEVA